jgi:hypothetical protein
MMTPASPVAGNLAALRQRIEKACVAAGRAPESVALLAVGKAQPVAALAAARDAGVRDFAENYLQEALPKIAALPRQGLRWHFIGPLQSNKTAEVARHFDWAHGVDREKIARRLSEQRPAGLPPLQVCVQVNISGEASKSGVAPDEAAALCRAVAALPRLKLRGLMAIPAPVAAMPVLSSARRARIEGGRSHDPREPYRRLRELFESLRRSGLELDTLSAGMSDDFEAAIAEGSTMVRIGTAIFGPRTP